jgi:hypothetical protein
MSSRAAQLAVELTERGAADVAGGMDQVTSSARRMGDTVEQAGKQADTARSRLDGTAEGADEMASKGSQAAGAMSGLGDLIGGPFGAAMATGGIGLQAMADSGDLLNAALENSIVQSARAKAATIGKTVADKASAAATKVMTVAQKALNLAQRASPVLLIVTGVLLLVGAIVLAYKRSETFRRIVQAALGAVKSAMEKVVAGFKALGPAVRAVMAFVAGVIRTYIRIYVTAFQLVLRGAQAAWDGIQHAASATIGWLVDRAADIRGKVAGAFTFLRDKGKAAFDALTAPIRSIIDLVQSLLDKISSIHIPHPHLPDLNPFRSGAFGGGSGGATSSSSDTVVLNLTVQAAVGTSTAQAQAQAQDMMDAIDARLKLVGRKPVFAR